MPEYSPFLSQTGHQFSRTSQALPEGLYLCTGITVLDRQGRIMFISLNQEDLGRIQTTPGIRQLGTEARDLL